MSDSSQPQGLKHARLPCPSSSSFAQLQTRWGVFRTVWPYTGICPTSCPLTQWYHSTISFSITPFSSCPQSFPASGSLPMSQFFASDGQSIGASSFSISPSSEYSGLTSFRNDWFCLLAFQGTSHKITAALNQPQTEHSETSQSFKFFSFIICVNFEKPFFSPAEWA